MHEEWRDWCKSHFQDRPQRQARAEKSSEWASPEPLCGSPCAVVAGQLAALLRLGADIILHSLFAYELIYVAEAGIMKQRTVLFV